MSVRRQLLLAGAVLALLGVRDFTQRIHVGRDAALRGFDRPVVDAAPAPLAADATRKQLVAWLPGLAGAEGAAPGAAVAWDLRLIGTFAQRRRPFAVIMATPRGGGASRTQRLGVGESIQGYKVTQIGSGSVTVENEAGPTALTVFRSVQGKGS